MQCGTKIKVKKNEDIGEIVGLFPAGQSFSIPTNGEEYYSVSINNYKGKISKSLFSILFEEVQQVKIDTPEDVSIPKKPTKRSKK